MPSPPWEMLLQSGLGVLFSIVLLWAFLQFLPQITNRLREITIALLNVQGLILLSLYRKRYEEETAGSEATLAKDCERCQADFAEAKRILQEQKEAFEKVPK